MLPRLQSSAHRFAGWLLMLNWLELVRQRLWRNLSASPISEKQKADVVNDDLAKMVADAESGRPFGAPEPEDDPLTSRGEKLSDLRHRARKEGGWEPWLGEKQ
jgi:hypothetical protein